MKFIIKKDSDGAITEPEIPKENIPPLVYHYCSMESFLAIIQNKNIRLSNSYALNDSRENTWINDYIDLAISDFRNSENNEFVEKFIRLFELNYFTPYVSCFSENGDLLSQWRGYSNDATGVAIGFDPKLFNIKFRPPFPGNSIDHTLGIVSVIYDHEIQSRLTKNILPSMYQALKHGKVDEGNALANCMYNFKKYSPVFKNPAFQEESEWRIIHTPLISRDSDHNIKLHSECSEVGYRVSNERLVTHFSLPFHSSPECAPVKEIVMGPRNSCDISSLELLLNDNGFKNVTIRKSVASYR